MKNKAAHLIICVGTLAGEVATRIKQACSKSQDFNNFVRYVVLDTAWDNVAFDGLEEREKLLLQGLPVSDIKSNPTAYPAFSQVVMEQMEDVGQLAAGAMRPTTTYAALIWRYQELESKILVGLQELGSLPVDGPASIWVLGSSASTTGRGTWLEVLMAARSVIKKIGAYHPLNGVAVDSEGLVPSDLPLRQRLQGTFFREMERADLSSVDRPIPRPHDVPWVFGLPADHVFRFCGATQDSNLSSVNELIANVSDWFITSLLNPVVYQLVSGPKGDRARLLPNVPTTDGHPIDPRSRYLICSGVSAITLNTAAVNQFVEAERGALTLNRVRGLKQPDVRNLVREFRLHYDALANEAEEVHLLAKVVGPTRELLTAWEKGSLEAWPGQVQNTKRNLAKYVEQATATVGGKVAKTIARIKDNIHERLTSFFHGKSSQGAGLETLGLNGAVALLTDAIQQADAASGKATAQMNNNTNLADSHRRIDEHLSKLGRVKMFNKDRRDDVVRELETAYSHAMRTVVAQGVQDGVVELRTWLQERLKVVRKAQGVVDQSLKVLERNKALALATTSNGSTLHLLTTEVEMQSAAATAQLIQPAFVESATGTLLEKLGEQFETLVGNLANSSPDELAQQAVGENTAVAPIVADLTGYFPTAFEAKFSRDDERVEALRWLVQKSKPLGGRVDLMLEHRLPAHARPAFQRNQALLLPATLAAKLAPVLAQLGVPANRIRAVEGLDAIVCVDEFLGLPAHAFPYLRMVGKLVPEDRDARAATTIARWGCEWLPSIDNCDPCQDWFPQDFLAAGMMLGAVQETGGEVVFHRSGGGQVTLGSSLEAAAVTLSQDGVCHDLKKAIKTVLANNSPGWLERLRHQAAARGVAAEQLDLAGRKLSVFQNRLGRA